MTEVRCGEISNKCSWQWSVFFVRLCVTNIATYMHLYIMNALPHALKVTL